MKYLLAFIVFIHLVVYNHMQLWGQSAYLSPHSYTAYQLQRLEIKQGKLADATDFNTSAGYYRRKPVVNFIDSFNTGGVKLSKQDYFNMRYIQRDNFEFTNANTLSGKKFPLGAYEYHSTFLGVKGKDYSVSLNPVTLLFAGYETNNDRPIMINNRGVEIRAQVGKNLGIYTHVQDERLSPSSHVQEFYTRFSVIPGESFINQLDSPVYTYRRAEGYIHYNLNNYIDMQFGHGNHFIGNGHRSLFLSDFGRPYLFGRVNTHFWKINYTNIYGAKYGYKPFGGRYTQNIDRSYFSTQYLSINATKRLQVGFFQSIVFYRDSVFNIRGFDMEYLNPVIFMKGIENGLNSPDKAFIGGDVKYILSNRISLYSQLLISEFRFSELIKGSGWVHNKFAYQVGAKYIDAFGVSNLDFQLEYNRVRPYTYSAGFVGNTYSSWNMPLAHPLGSNFHERIFIARYQPSERLFFNLHMMHYVQGRDTANSNWGGDVNKTYRNPPRQYGNVVGQGVTTTVLMQELTASYMWFHNFFVDVRLGYRSSSSIVPGAFESNNFWVGMGVRWNMNMRRYDF
jgi:hypothetical protein